MEMIGIYLGVGLSLLAGIVASIIAWKVANFFIARREFYVKSQYEILMKKLGWCFSWGIFIAYIGISIVVPKKDKNLKPNKEVTIPKTEKEIKQHKNGN